MCFCAMAGPLPLRLADLTLLVTVECAPAVAAKQSFTAAAAAGNQPSTAESAPALKAKQFSAA